jgi:hypothetical protein
VVVVVQRLALAGGQDVLDHDLGLADGVLRVRDAEAKGIEFSGPLAWLMHRGYHAYAMPTLDRKFRILRRKGRPVDVRRVRAWPACARPPGRWPSRSSGEDRARGGSGWCCALGTVAGLGLYKGAANLKGIEFSGPLAWLMHRGYHAYAMPTLDRMACCAFGTQKPPGP